MTTFANLAVSILDPADLTTNLGDITAATYASGTSGFDRVGDGRIRVPVGATNTDLLVRGNIVYARSQSSLASPAVPLRIAIFIIDNISYSISSGIPEIEASGSDLLEELKWRSIGEDIIADTIDATLSATVDPTEIATTLSATASGGASAVSVTSATNFNFGQTISIALDAGGTHDTTITNVSGTTITLADTVPSTATSGNAVTTMTGFLLALSSGGYSVGQPAYVELDDGSTHVGTIIEVLSGPNRIIITPGIPTIATSGNNVYQYTFLGSVVPYLFANYAPANWDAPIVTGPNVVKIFGANETVFEALLLCTRHRGHFRLVVSNPPVRQIEWLPGPDASAVTDLLVAGGADPNALDPSIGIIHEFTQVKSEQTKRVTRIYTRGANGLKFTTAEPYITVDGDYTVDWAGGVIIASAAEAGGAARVDKYVPFEDIQALGNTEAQVIEAAIRLYQVAFNWLEDQETPDPIFYDVTCTVHQHMVAFTTINLTYSRPGLELAVTGLVVHQVTHEMGQDGRVITRLRLGGQYSWQNRKGEDWQSDNARRMDTAFRHWGSPYATQGGLMIGGNIHHHDLLGLADNDHLQYLLTTQGTGLLVSSQVVSLNTPATVSLSSTNLTGPNHTHEFDETGLLTTAANVIAGTGLTSTGSIATGITINVTGASPSGLTIAADSVAIADSIAGAGLTISSKVLAVGAGAGLTVNADDVALTTPGTITSTSINASAGNHTHAIDATILTTAANVIAGAGLTSTGSLASGITLNVGAGNGILVAADSIAVDLAIPSGLSFSGGDLQIDDSVAGAGLAISSKVLAVGAGAGITVNANDVALTTPGTITSTSTNASAGNHTHAIDATIATSANTVTAGNGLTGGGAITSNPTITMGTPGTLTVSTSNGVTATSHTHAITSSNAVTTATAILLATNGSGYLQTLRFGAGIAPTAPLHALSSANATALQVEAPSLIGSPAVSIQNVPLSSDLDTGKALEFKVTSESFGRVMLYSDGKIGVGPGSATRDTILSRSAANTWRISSDGGSGAAHLRVNDGAWIGIASNAGRIGFVNTTDDEIRVNDANFYMHNGTSDTVILDRVNGRIFVNETADGNVTAGLVINQGTSDDFLLTMKSSDILHGITDFGETDTYAAFQKYDAIEGGVRMWGFSEGNVGINIRGAVTSGNSPTNGATSVGAIMLQSEIKVGTGTGSLGANHNLVVIRNRADAKFMVDSEGDIHRDGSLDNAFDTFNDAHLVRALSLELSPRTAVRSTFDQFLQHNRQDLIAAGVLHESGFYNESALTRLHSGAIWQLHQRIAKLEERVTNGH